MFSLQSNAYLACKRLLIQFLLRQKKIDSKEKKIFLFKKNRVVLSSDFGQCCMKSDAW